MLPAEVHEAAEHDAREPTQRAGHDAQMASRASPKGGKTTHDQSSETEKQQQLQPRLAS